MKKIVPKVPALGNTKQGPKKQISPAKKWCFTLNNYDDEKYNSLLTLFQSSNKLDKWIIGKEIGEQGTPHLQGYICFVKKSRPFELTDNKKIHWEKCRGSEEDNIKYCSKDGNFVHSKNIKVKKPLKILKDEQLYDWEINIVNIIKNEPDDRKIYWLYETEGGVGKTTFCKYLCHKFGACIVEGKKNDILYCAAEYDSDIYIFDLERSMEDYVSYAAIEKIKNGLYMCSKYESKPIIRNPPHILIFANFEPDFDKLSKDRWEIIKL